MLIRFIKKIFTSQFRLNMFSGMAATSVNMVITFVSYPIYLHYLGYQRLGVWLVLSTILVFVQLCNLGIGPAVMKLVAEEHGHGNLENIRAYIATALITLVATGLIAWIVLVLLGPRILGLFNLFPDDLNSALSLLPYIGGLTVYVFLVQVFTATLSGLGRMDLVNYTDSVSRAIALLIGALFLSVGFGITGLLIGSVGSNIFTHAITFFFLRKVISLRLFHAFRWDKRCFRKIITFGSGISGGSLINMLLSPFNKLMLSRYVGVSTITVYEIASAGSMQIRSLIETALRSMVPEISRLTGETADPIRKKIITINRRAFSVIFLGGLPAYLLIFAFATPLLKIWLGHTFLETIPVAFRIMLVATFVSLLGVPAYYTFMGQGNFKFCVFSHMIQSIMNVFVVAIIIYFWVDALVPGIYVAVLTGFCGSSIYLMWKLWNEFCRPVPINRESERRESMLTPKKIA